MGTRGAPRPRPTPKGRPLSEQAVAWLASGKRGTSSNTIFAHLSGIDALGGWHESHPHDPGDLGRCRLLLDQVPEFKARLGEMRKVSPVWNRLVDSWQRLCDLMDQEAPDWREGRGSCPKTYELMKELGC